MILKSLFFKSGYKRNLLFFMKKPFKSSLEFFTTFFFWGTISDISAIIHVPSLSLHCESICYFEIFLQYPSSPFLFVCHYCVVFFYFSHSLALDQLSPTHRQIKKKANLFFSLLCCDLCCSLYLSVYHLRCCHCCCCCYVILLSFSRFPLTPQVAKQWLQVCVFFFNFKHSPSLKETNCRW